jgi:transglutaminase-like putative cysteine protease
VEFELTYHTEYQYAPAVPHGLSVLRLRPADGPDQRVLSADLRAEPADHLATFTDGWETAVDVVRFPAAHERATFHLRAHIVTGGGAPAPPAIDERWIHTQPSARVPVGEAASLREEIGRAGGNWADVAYAVAWIHERFTFWVGETDVNTPLAAFVAARRGVCQDFAHLACAVLRGWGWPARYVSGYQFSAHPDAGSVQAEAMHAWIEVAHREDGWHGFDPTTGDRADDRYVVVGRGRDYDDVTPVRGLLRGETSQTHHSRLRIEQIAPQQ